MLIGMVSLVLMLVFMLLTQFGALDVPLAAWIIWTVVSLVLLAVGYRFNIPTRTG